MKAEASKTWLGSNSSVEDVVNDCLEHFDYQDAIYLSELYFSHSKTDATLGLVASVYYKANQLESVYSLLTQHGCRSPRTKYLLAKCCVDMDKLSEAEMVIDEILEDPDTRKDEFKSCRAFTLRLQGQIESRSNGPDMGAQRFRESLHLQPFIWSSFERLCDLDKNTPIKPFEIFNSCKLRTPPTKRQDLEEAPSQTCSGRLTPLNNLNTPGQPSSTPLPLLEEPPDLDAGQSQNGPTAPDSTPNLPPVPNIVDAPKKLKKNASRREDGGNLRRSGRITRASVSALTTNNPRIHLRGSRRSENVKENTDTERSISKRAQRGGRQLLGTGNRLDFDEDGRKEKVGEDLPPQSLLINPTPTPTQPPSKDPTQLPALLSPAPLQPPPPRPPTKEIKDIPKLEFFLRMLKKLGEIQVALSQFDFTTCVNHIAKLPDFLRNSPSVLLSLAKAHFEAAHYHKAVEVFKENRRRHPHYLLGTDTYSTALWHLQRETELSVLAQTLTSRFRNAHQTWCVVGNCFSALKENEKAIRFFQRAIQLKPDFPYAYTLLGHEYLAMDNPDKALHSFRAAARLDRSHYNAWFGLGQIAYRQEQISLAQYYFQTAAKINPRNPVLQCQLSVVEQALGKTKTALEILDRALETNPDNPRCRYHKAQLLFSKGTPEALQESLDELEKLKQIVPKEGNIYFLVGKIHKTLEENHMAVSNFTWATQLDPRGEQQNPYIRRYEDPFPQNMDGELSFGDGETSSLSSSF